MLFSYITSCLYILTLGSYWIYSTASTLSYPPPDLPPSFEPGTITSLITLLLLLLLIISSIIYFCYLRYFLKLTHKQIVSQTMNHCQKGWWIVIGIDVVLGIVIYYFAIKENMDDRRDFIKLHLLFIIMILFVGSWNGLRWFRVRRKVEGGLFAVLLGATVAMYFIEFYFHAEKDRLHSEYHRSKSTALSTLSSTPHPHRPQFQHYISGPLIITYQYLYLSLSTPHKYFPQKIICKLIQYFSISVFTKRMYFLVKRAKPETYFSFDFIWAVILCVMTVGIMVRDLYCLVKVIIKRVRRKDREKYVQEFRGRVQSYLEERTDEKEKRRQRGKDSLEGSDIELKIDDQIGDCTVCLSTLSDGRIAKLDCNHEFHYGCIFEWFNRETVCPVCRRKFQVVVGQEEHMEIEREMERERGVEEVNNRG